MQIYVLFFQVTEIFSTSCMFSFGPPKDDGGLPLTFYTVERQDFSLKGRTITCWSTYLHHEPTSSNDKQFVIIHFYTMVSIAETCLGFF